MFKKVIWATDTSEQADRALEYARTLAADSAGELLVLHCIELTLPGKGPGGRYPVHADEDDEREKLHRQVAELSSDGVKATLQIETASVGEAARVIADVAKDAGADVIVVGTRGRTTFAGLLLGSVTHRLLHIAPCPVLAVPQPHDSTAGA